MCAHPWASSPTHAGQFLLRDDFFLSDESFATKQGTFFLVLAAALNS